MADETQDRIMYARVIKPRALSVEERVAIMRSIMEEAPDDMVRKSMEAAIRKLQREQQSAG